MSNYQLKKMRTTRGTVTVMQDGQLLFRRRGVEISFHNKNGVTVPKAHFRLDGQRVTREISNGVVTI